MTLPYELRLQVYELALEGLLERAPCICAQYCNRKHFTTLRSLALANRKIGAEVRRLFIKQYSRKICFYFNDAFRLQEFHAYIANQPTLRNAQFCLRVQDIPVVGQNGFDYNSCLCCVYTNCLHNNSPYRNGDPPARNVEGIDDTPPSHSVHGSQGSISCGKSSLMVDMPRLMWRCGTRIPHHRRGDPHTGGSRIAACRSTMTLRRAIVNSNSCASHVRQAVCI